MDKVQSNHAITKLKKNKKRNICLLSDAWLVCPVNLVDNALFCAFNLSRSLVLTSFPKIIYNNVKTIYGSEVADIWSFGYNIRIDFWSKLIRKPTPISISKNLLEFL